MNRKLNDLIARAGCATMVVIMIVVIVAGIGIIPWWGTAAAVGSFILFALLAATEDTYGEVEDGQTDA